MCPFAHIFGLCVRCRPYPSALSRFYLGAGITNLKHTPNAALLVPENQVLELVFKRVCGSQDPAIKPPSGTSIVNWMNAGFGPGSPDGHTVLHPHKTDACDRCCRLDADLQSTAASLKRHHQQHDVTIFRTNAITELETTLGQLRAAQEEHLAEAQTAKEAYTQTQDAASHPRYAELTAQFNALPRAAFQADGEPDPGATEEHRWQVEAMVEAAAGFKGTVDSDFQMDKAAPWWGHSPQPGPT